MRRNKGDTRASVNKLALTKVGLNVRDWLTLSALFFGDIRAEGKERKHGRRKLTNRMENIQMSLTGRVLPARKL